MRVEFAFPKLPAKLLYARNNGTRSSAIADRAADKKKMRAAEKISSRPLRHARIYWRANYIARRGGEKNDAPRLKLAVKCAPWRSRESGVRWNNGRGKENAPGVGCVATKRATCYTKVTRKIQYWFRKYTKSVRKEQVVVGIGSSRCAVFLFSLALRHLRIQTIGRGVPPAPRIVFKWVIKRPRWFRPLKNFGRPNRGHSRGDFKNFPRATRVDSGFLKSS